MKRRYLRKEDATNDINALIPGDAGYEVAAWEEILNLNEDPNNTLILNWMERFDKWAQAKSMKHIIQELHSRGYKPYTVDEAPAILSQRGYVLVESGPQLHIPFVLNHKVVWGGNGIIAISPSKTIIPAIHTI